MLSRIFKLWMGAVVLLDTIMSGRSRQSMQCFTLTPEKRPSNTLSTEIVTCIEPEDPNSATITRFINEDINIYEEPIPGRNAIVSSSTKRNRQLDLYILFQQDVTTIREYKNANQRLFKFSDSANKICTSGRVMTFTESNEAIRKKICDKNIPALEDACRRRHRN